MFTCTDRAADSDSTPESPSWNQKTIYYKKRTLTRTLHIGNGSQAGGSAAGGRAEAAKVRRLERQVEQKEKEAAELEEELKEVEEVCGALSFFGEASSGLVFSCLRASFLDSLFSFSMWSVCNVMICVTTHPVGRTISLGSFVGLAFAFSFLFFIFCVTAANGATAAAAGGGPARRQGLGQGQRTRQGARGQAGRARGHAQDSGRRNGGGQGAIQSSISTLDFSFYRLFSARKNAFSLVLNSKASLQYSRGLVSSFFAHWLLFKCTTFHPPPPSYNHLSTHPPTLTPPQAESDQARLQLEEQVQRLEADLTEALTKLEEAQGAQGGAGRAGDEDTEAELASLREQVGRCR